MPSPVLSCIVLSHLKVWSLMKVICFEDNARGGLLTHLGFDSTTIAAAAEAYVRSKTGHVLPPPQHTIAAPPRSLRESNLCG